MSRRASAGASVQWSWLPRVATFGPGSRATKRVSAASCRIEWFT